METTAFWLLAEKILTLQRQQETLINSVQTLIIAVNALGQRQGIEWSHAKQQWCGVAGPPTPPDSSTPSQ